MPDTAHNKVSSASELGWTDILLNVFAITDNPLSTHYQEVNCCNTGTDSNLSYQFGMGICLFDKNSKRY